MSFVGVRSERTVRHVFLTALVAGLALGTVGRGAPQDAPPEAAQPQAAPAVDTAWHDTVTLIRAGRFEDANAKVAKLVRSDAAVERLAHWLDAWNEQAHARAEMTLADYEGYVKQARKYHDEADLPKALSYAVRALNNAVSKDAFRKEEWLKQLTNDAMLKGAELRGKNEWLDALSLYYEVGEIFEHDSNVRKLIRECRTHARIDAVYTEDNKWQERLVGIEPRMVEEAFREVSQKYVEDANFRAITEAGLEQMLLLAQSASLRELFPSLKDDTERGGFEARIRANLAKVRNADVVDFKVAREQFDNALRINRQTVQLPEPLVISEYMEAALEELDEFTAMIWPAQIKEFEKHTRGDFPGVGIQIRQHYNPDLKDYEVVVVSPIEDSPAYAAGIQAGDIITQVNGAPLLGVSLNKAVETITGPVGTSVTLTLRRGSDATEREYVLKRTKIKIQSIKGFARSSTDDQRWQYVIDPEYGIAYIRVVSFQENTVEDFVKTINEINQDHSLRGLVLDLRFNPGGLLRAAVQFSELFLNEDDLIVSTRGLHSPKWEIPASRRGPLRDLPLVVLVNDSSASASEIVAGALKDHHRGVILGERTFGKFSVQNLIQLAQSDAHLKLTTARYYLPSGRSLHRDETSVEWGVEPDISVPLVAKEVVKIVQNVRKRDIIGHQSDTLAQKILSDEEADMKAEAERAKKNGGVADPTEAAPDGAAPEVPTSAPGADLAATTAPAGEEEVDRNDRPDIDPQLDAALLVMRAHLLDVSSQMVARRNALTEEARPE